MKLRQSITIKAPRDFVFREFTNAENILHHIPENITMRPKAGAKDFSKGSEWQIEAKKSVRKFLFDTIIEDVTPSETFGFKTTTNRLEIQTQLAFKEISPEITEVVSEYELKPRGLLGRVLLQTIKSSKPRISKYADAANVKLAGYIEDLYHH